MKSRGKLCEKVDIVICNKMLEIEREELIRKRKNFVRQNATETEESSANYATCTTSSQTRHLKYVNKKGNNSIDIDFTIFKTLQLYFQL